MSKTKNDDAWEQIFVQHNIIESVSTEGFANITSNEINKFREARLMTKFDHSSQLPKLFVDNELSILPTSRGSYIIGKFDMFHCFDNYDVEVKNISFPVQLESLNFKDITSEATAINCAFVSNILSDFTNEENLFPTVSGRMSSSSFDFNINSSNGLHKINVENSQIEIDGGYEGENSLNLIEAKNYISDDFLVRQLYYPYKLWVGKVSKKVRPIFLTYTNGIFHLREYAFEDINHYNSIKLINEKKYSVQDGTINLELIQKILKKIPTVVEPEVPFPQANSFERVINLCELLKQRGLISKEDLTLEYDFDKRQTDYYSNAGKYLGLIDNKPENGQTYCFMTDEGYKLFEKSIFERQIEFIKLILSHSVFKQSLNLYLEKGDAPNHNEIVIIMKSSNLYNIESDDTFRRRSSTVLSWINWIVEQMEE